MKKFKLIICFIICITLYNAKLISQCKSICHLETSHNISLPADGIEEFNDAEEAEKYITKLMNKVGLPMNFDAYECSDISCKNNAYAQMNIHGKRFIVYDNNWFKNLDTDSSNIESLTILSHEIGHHISAHTLSLNYLSNEDAVKYCDPRSKKYNNKICEENYKANYFAYLRKSRIQELEADRFSGFIMCLYGIELNKVIKTFKKISSNYVDTLSTHPRLDKRINAVTAGYNLALSKKAKNDTIYDIQEIKGMKLEYPIKRLSKIERNRIVSNLEEHINWKPMCYIDKNSKIDFNRGAKSFPNEIKERIVKYHGNKDNIFEIDSEEYYFKALRRCISHSHEKEISFAPWAGIEIKNNTLKILVFNSNTPRCVYTSPFDEEEISYEEIKTIFIEIYNDGINQAIRKYEEKN